MTVPGEGDSGGPWAAPVVRRGHDYDDFTPGQRFDHHFGRTIFETDNVLFTTLTLHFNPMYFNAEVAKARGYAATPVNPLLILGTVVSLSVEDLSEHSEAFLGVDEVVFHKPIYPGDTLSAHSVVLEKRRSKSRPAFGVVSWHTEARDQRHETVISFRRANLFRLEAGEELPLAAAPVERAQSTSTAPAAGSGAPQPPERTGSLRLEGALYFEDFRVGQRMRHGRGKTVTEMDNVLLSNLMLNTADGHFDAHQASRSAFGERMVFGGVIAGIVVGLSAAETAEAALRELRLDAMRFAKPVFHGDTLYAVSEVLEAASHVDGEAGIVRFRHVGLNQRDELVFECERSVLVARRPG